MADKNFKVKNSIVSPTPIALSEGGTGQTTANNALNALLPVQTSANGKYLTSNGTNASWDAPAGYSAPTIGSTSIPSGSTVSTIEGLSLTSPYIISDGTFSMRGKNTSGDLTWSITDTGMSMGTSGTSANYIEMGAFKPNDSESYIDLYSTNGQSTPDLKLIAKPFVSSLSPQFYGIQTLGNFEVAIGSNKTKVFKVTETGAEISGSISATTATFGNVSNTEIQYLDGVTSAIQTQLDAKAPSASPTFTGTITVGSSTGTSGQVLTSTGTGVKWDSTATVPNNNINYNSYVVTSSDNGKFIYNTYQVDINTSTGMTIGQNFIVFNSYNSNIPIGTGVGVTLTLAGTTTTGTRTLAQNGVATIMCVGTNSYVIAGTGLT